MVILVVGTLGISRDRWGLTVVCLLLVRIRMMKPFWGVRSMGRLAMCVSWVVNVVTRVWLAVCWLWGIEVLNLTFRCMGLA